VFFMISSLSMAKFNAIKVALPKTSSSPETMDQKVVLSVKKNGDIFVNKVAVSLNGVGQTLALLMKDHPQSAVLVNADEGANYGVVIKVMDQARLVGVRKFALSTEPTQ
jgi:biopolymer transport protein ExbD